MTQYLPLQKIWSVDDLFGHIKPSDILLNDALKRQYREFFFCDLKAESDAENLYSELTNHYKFSDNFYKFLEIWYVDEKRHAEGFRKIIHLLYGDNEQELKLNMLERRADFSELREFFEDEFKMCVLFAYDEHASNMTYRKDTFYKEFGPPEFVEWIVKIAGDEARHFGNVIKLIHHQFKHRISETKAVLEKILAFENSSPVYKATFLFDHDGEHFLLSNDELNNRCAEKVFKTITAGVSI